MITNEAKKTKRKRNKVRLIFLSIFLVLFSGVFIFEKTIPKAQAAPCSITVTNTNDSGAGSLRQAIVDANVAPDQDTVCFNIGGGGLQTIIPTSALPAITKEAIIDGTTQPGFSSAPIIELRGTGSGASAVGIWITAGGSTVKGMIINNYSLNGIFITNNSGNTITGNYIGTNSSGTSASPNGTDGIGIYNSSNHTIGGSTAAERNVVSGNTGNGIGITDDDNPGSATGNVIKGNYVGTNPSGTGAVPNVADGILINNGGSNTVGGTTGVTVDGACTGECNLISGNDVNGVGLWYESASSNSILGNFIGTNVNGIAAVPNGDIAVEINEAPNNTVGGTTAASRNILSGNTGAGILLTGAASTGNNVQGNYIGTNTTGTAAVPNVKMGISIGWSPTGIQSASNNNIGGTTGVTLGGACTGACNLISGNTQNGIFITNNTSGGANHVFGNYIGTNAAGTGSIPNAIDAVGILDAPNNTIGGTTDVERNIISGNTDKGVIVAGDGSTGNRISNNYIGLATDGSSLGNGTFGVMIAGGIDTAILQNSIFANGDLGIDLGFNRVSANDGGDGDAGANRIQNYPKVFADTVSGVTRAYGSLNSTPSTNFRLEFFQSDSCNAGYSNTFGEGQTYLGTTTVGTDVFGNISYSFSSPTAMPGGKFITATATKMIGSTAAETSEFSECSQVNASKPAEVAGSTWNLRGLITSGAADTFTYGFPASFLMCAWDSNQPGVKLPVVFSNGTWFMRGSHTTGGADNTFGYGPLGSRPVCGDWNGDGTESVGVVDGSNSWYLRNSNSSGSADLVFQYGPYGATPIVGDWDGDGDDTIGIYLNGGGWSLRNSNSSGPEDVAFSYGFLGAKPVVGDWNGDGSDTIGVVGEVTWMLRNSNSSGPIETSFLYGSPGATVLTWR